MLSAGNQAKVSTQQHSPKKSCFLECIMGNHHVLHCAGHISPTAAKHTCTSPRASPGLPPWPTKVLLGGFVLTAVGCSWVTSSCYARLQRSGGQKWLCSLQKADSVHRCFGFTASGTKYLCFPVPSLNQHLPAQPR